MRHFVKRSHACSDELNFRASIAIATLTDIFERRSL